VWNDPTRGIALALVFEQPHRSPLKGALRGFLVGQPLVAA